MTDDKDKRKNQLYDYSGKFYFQKLSLLNKILWIFDVFLLSKIFLCHVSLYSESSETMVQAACGADQGSAVISRKVNNCYFISCKTNKNKNFVK